MKKAKAIAATVEAPTTLGTTMRPAPLLLELLALDLAVVDGVVVVSGFEDVLEGVEPVDNADVEEPPGVVVPLISA